MSTELYVFSLLAILGTLLAIFGLRSAASARQMRAGAADALACRDIAARSAAAQAETAARLAGIEAELVRLAAGVTAIEKMLGEVG